MEGSCRIACCGHDSATPCFESLIAFAQQACVHVYVAEINSMCYLCLRAVVFVQTRACRAVIELCCEISVYELRLVGWPLPLIHLCQMRLWLVLRAIERRPIEVDALLIAHGPVESHLSRVYRWQLPDTVTPEAKKLLLDPTSQTICSASLVAHQDILKRDSDSILIIW
jgi:hypothetical protein